MPAQIQIKDAAGTTQTVSTMDALVALLGALNDSAVTSSSAGSATLLGLLRGILRNTGVAQSVPAANLVRGVSAASTDAVAKPVIAAPGAGLALRIKTLIVSNSSATDTEVEILDGATVIAVVPAAKGMGGAIVPIEVRLTVNTALNFRCRTAGASVTVTAAGVVEA